MHHSTYRLLVGVCPRSGYLKMLLHFTLDILSIANVIPEFRLFHVGQSLDYYCSGGFLHTEVRPTMNIKTVRNTN